MNKFLISIFILNFGWLLQGGKEKKEAPYGLLSLEALCLRSIVIEKNKFTLVKDIDISTLSQNLQDDIGHIEKIYLNRSNKEIVHQLHFPSIPQRKPVVEAFLACLDNVDQRFFLIQQLIGAREKIKKEDQAYRENIEQGKSETINIYEFKYSTLQEQESAFEDFLEEEKKKCQEKCKKIIKRPADVYPPCFAGYFFHRDYPYEGSILPIRSFSIVWRSHKDWLP